ncbi:hypothetical protein B0J18DRAFT_165020 [Chaetomium sp. MPI-SDFR-AT-0129]|nr:hypothetical protein B0J18DRAFT_165020 [Chaetomium sp. MPI-SDFR-AT-0129]
MRETNNIRLRLVVRRHSLPEVRVVFPVRLDADPTIANLLEQVNEIIPLESNDWGLEDYSVELRDANGHGFDCLHFQPVSLILKNDEEVFIRPLDTGDRRKRRLTGRDQISTDGKHLIDGIAFGRPRLRTPRDRPVVDIPPLKRRRITYDNEEGDIEPPQLLLTERGEVERPRHTVRFDLASAEPEEAEEEDEDFVINESDEEDAEDDLDQADLEDELRDLQAENEESTNDKRLPTAGQGRPAGLDLQTLDKIANLRAAFPTAGFEACEKSLAKSGGDAHNAYLDLQIEHRPRVALNDILPDTPTDVAAAEDADDESDAESVASMVKHFDQHGFPSGSILAGTAAAQIAEVMRQSGHAVKLPVHTKFDEDTADQGPTPREEVAGESDADAADDDDSESYHESDSGSESGDGSDDDSESNDGSERDSGPEVASSKLPEGPGATPDGDVTSPTSEESDHEGNDDEDSSEDSDDEAASGDDGENEGGESEDSSQADGSDVDDESDNDFDNDNASGPNTNENPDDVSGTSEGAPDVDSEDSSASGNASEESESDDDSSDESANDTTKPITSPAKTTQARPLEVQDDNRLGPAMRPAEPGIPVPPGQGKTATKKRNARRRLAIAAKKAVARGELLLPTSEPKPPPAAEPIKTVPSFADKKAALLKVLGAIPMDALEQALLPNVDTNGPSQQQKPTDVTPKPDLTQQPDEKPTVEVNPDAWRDKIVYRAVECCQEGVELSEPPFPFVQRWDPQQQFFYKHDKTSGGRSKRKQRDQDVFVDGGKASGKKRRKSNWDSSYETDRDDEQSYTNPDDTVLNYDDEPSEPQAPGHGWEETEGVQEEDDLPTLPPDVSHLPLLAPGKARPGMIITWNQWLLSKGTNWQPQVSPLTGVVVEVFDDNQLQVRLAKRDRNLDRNERTYDEDGNRVYDKFELPGADEDSEDLAEAGYRDLDFADLIEPRILQPAPDTAATGVSELPGGVQDEAVPEGELPDVEHGAEEPQQGSDKNGTVPGPFPQIPQRNPDTPISEDRRHEISLLINNAGFRKDVDPSVAKMAENDLDLSSPSRQLEEMTHEATLLSQDPDSLDESNPKLPSKIPSHDLESHPTVVLEPFHGFSDAASDVPTECQVAYPKLALPPSETDSMPSGRRQVDPDFSIDLGGDSFHDPEDPALTSRSTIGRHTAMNRIYPHAKPNLTPNRMPNRTYL